MPSGMAMAAAITVDRTVRSTVLTKSKPSRPPARPLYMAWKVSTGDGNSTGSTICFQTAMYQSAIRPITPSTGRNGSNARFIPLLPFANLALEHLETVRLGGDEALLRKRFVAARARRVEMHKIGDPRRPA